MKKITLALFAILMMAVGAQAQHVFNKGDLAMNAGIGVLGGYGFIPSIEASVEYGVIPTGDIGLVSFGGMIGYKYSVDSYSYSYINSYSADYDFHQFIFGGRATWHLHSFESDKWDAYAGLGIGGRIYSVYDGYDFAKDEPKYDGKFGVYQEVFVGGRMMMSSVFGLFAEVGYSPISNARFGITLYL